MLEGLATWVLNTYLGEYVENLNTDQLSIALLQGAVELENLTLKKDALKNLDLPVQVKSGLIGKVSLQIPITLLRSEKWVISMEKLYLVAGPLQNVQYDEEKEKKSEQKRKEELLKALEKQWKIEDREVGGKSWFSFSSSMASTILENLQVIVKDVHIRYEDDNLSPSGPTACGVKISSLSAQSTDISWVPMFINNRSSEMMHKLVDLQDFAVYWDDNSVPLDISSQECLLNAMDQDSSEVRGHNFMLEPVTAQAKMRRNTCDLPLRSIDSPRITFDVSMDRIPVCLAHSQFHGLVLLMKQIDYHNRRRKYRKYRPQTENGQLSARELWWFAIDCHMNDIRERNRRLTKQFMLKRASDNVVYYHAYFSELVNTYVDTNLKMVMSKIEEELSFSELKILRELAFNKVLAEGKIPKNSSSRTSNQSDVTKFVPPTASRVANLAAPETVTTVAVPAPAPAPGLFQSWFPGWGGWYSAPNDPSNMTESTLAIEQAPDQPKELQIDSGKKPAEYLRKLPSPQLLNLMEKEILGVLNDFAENDTLLKRDLVFAVLNFTLNSGSFKLNSSGAKLNETKCLIEAECTTIKMRLESRPRSAFTQVSLSLGGLYVRDRVVHDSMFTNLVSPQNKSRGTFLPEQSSVFTQTVVKLDEPIFTFLWESKPSNSKSNYKLHLKMKPLDIIYSTQTSQVVQDFFSKRKGKTAKIPSNARQKIETLKNQTKAELRNTIDRLLEGEDVILKSRWDIHLDIAAPRLIIPDDFHSPNTPLVIIDLGNLKFHSGSVVPPDTGVEETFDDDDVFRTPCSTPPGELDDTADQVPEVKDILNVSSDASILDKLYDRRLVFTTDPQLPSATLSGNISNLTLHLDELKMQSLNTCFNRLIPSNTPPPTPEFNRSLSTDDVEMAEDKTEHNHTFSATSLGRELQAESKLLLVQFMIDELSMQIQSNGMSLAELRVGGVRANFSKHPYKMSANFSIHSLLIVDALQTFGPDFELLVASHKNLSLDQTSLSICDSNPASPQSPQSPIETTVPTSYPISHQTMFSALSSVANQSDTKTDPQKNPSELSIDKEAIISIDLEVISADSPTLPHGDPSVRKANIQFNNLDVIANQYTVMELISFFARVIPTKPKQAQTTSTFTIEPTISIRTEVAAEFRNLNVLLLRIVNDKGKQKAARKVATATMSCAKISAALDNELHIEGSIGGLELRDVTPEGTLHQSIISVGVLNIDNASTKPSAPPQMYQTAYEGFYPVIKPVQEETKAFSVNISKSSDKLSNSRTFDVSLHTASVCYTHSPRFLAEFGQCVSEFQEYIKKVSASLKYAATEVAKGIVSKRSSDITNPYYGSVCSLDSLHITANETAFNDSAVSEKKLCIKMNAGFDSPVIVLPRTSDSNEALVAHLGKIYVRNTAFDEAASSKSAPDLIFRDYETDKIYVEFRNMNMYSVDLAKRDGSTKKRPPFLVNIQSNIHPYIQCKSQTPVIYDTNIEFTVEMVDNPIINLDETQELIFDVETSPKKSPHPAAQIPETEMMINMKIATPLKAVLTKNIYEQILQTMDNVTYDDRRDPTFMAENVAQKMTQKILTKTGKPTENIEETPEPTSPLPPKQTNMILKLKFEVPEFDIEMRGEFGEGEQGLVDLKLTNFMMNFEKSNPYSTKVDLALHSLIMEDLLVDPTSEHRYLMVSSTKSNLKPTVSNLSSSCPISSIVTPVAEMPPSLPSSLVDISNVFTSQSRTLNPIRPEAMAPKKKTKDRSCSITPPPSPLSRRGSHGNTAAYDALVEINIVIIDKNAPEYVTQLNRTNRYIDIKFNSLDTTINLQTWVVLLDFIGMGAKIHDADVLTGNTPKPDDFSSTATAEVKPEFVNSNVQLSIQNFSITFNKQEYELSRFNVTKFTSLINTHDGDLSSSAQLGALSLLDQSPEGVLYRHKFITVGEKALDFEMYKYGLPDPHLSRPFDISIKIHMSSVRYTHCQRFHMEILAFCQNFLKLQDVLGRQRAASAGKKLTETALRGSRIQLDIEAGAPILLIPESSRSPNVLVMDLGHFTIKNKFIFDNEPGTIKHQANAARDEKSTTESPPKAAKRQKSDPVIHKMTQSMYNDFLPPCDDHNPMTDSIYGSLDHDLRAAKTDSNLPKNKMSENTSSILIDDWMFPQTSAVRREHYFHKLTPEATGYDSSVDLDQDALESAIDSPVMGNSDVKFDSCVDKPDIATLKPRSSLADTLQSVPSLSFYTNINTEMLDHICLLDVMHIAMTDINLYIGTRVHYGVYDDTHSSDLLFPSCIITRRQDKHKILQEKCVLDLQVERNLEGDISHVVPDFNISGSLSSAYFILDLPHYKIIKGILDHNLGEPLEEFQTPLLTYLPKPEIQTVLTGEGWKVVRISLDLSNVTVELLNSNKNSPNTTTSLARLDFVKSHILYESYSNQRKDVDLTSQEIVAHDTRYDDAPANARPSVYTTIIQPSPTSTTCPLQLQLHFRSTRNSKHFTILLNNMRLICIFDWLLSVQEFLLTNSDSPLQKEPHDLQPPSSPGQVTRSMSDSKVNPTYKRSPLFSSGGIATKRGTCVQKNDVPFELKLNVNDTDFVVVEDVAKSDSNAVILRCTAVLMYKPLGNDKPLSCSLQSLEVFSCCLMSQDETALSIIDPMTVQIDLNANPPPKPGTSASAGLLDASTEINRILELEVTFNTMNVRLSYHAMMMSYVHQVTFNTMNVRLSYHDMMMFYAILNTLPTQAQFNISSSISAIDLTQLRELGFCNDDCKRALQESDGCYDDAVKWLKRHAVALPSKIEVKKTDLTITALEVKADCIQLVIIDDCKDTDVPLLELSLSGISAHHTVKPAMKGRTTLQLSGDYYNRALSGWEPFLEPWRCHVNWEESDDSGMSRLSLNIGVSCIAIPCCNNCQNSMPHQSHEGRKYSKYPIPREDPTPTIVASSCAYIAPPLYSSDASEVLNLNVTSALLDLYTKTKVLWMDDYINGQDQDGMIAEKYSHQRRRMQFVPFSLKNETGSSLWFHTMTTSPSCVNKFYSAQSDAYIESTNWKQVEPGESLPFFIQGREKMRHKKSHELHIHQLVVRVDGWRCTSPVSVDKIGIYFRYIQPDSQSPYSKTGTVMNSTRIVFEVRQEGNAKKEVTVRSALVVVNNLESPLDVRMHHRTVHQTTMQVAAKCRLPIPFKCLSAKLWIRPSDWSVNFCNDPIHWTNVTKGGEIMDETRVCQVKGDVGLYRFCVSTRREMYPDDIQLTSGQTPFHIPGHTITVTSPLVLVNLLPTEFSYQINSRKVTGTLSPDTEHSVHVVDLTQNLELGITMENYPTFHPLVIPPGTTNYVGVMVLLDTNNRPLELSVRISARRGGSLKIYLSTPYWLTNRSGCPLLFKQDQNPNYGAGQGDDHEQARSIAPLLFSYADRDYPPMCSGFSLESGVSVRQLHVVQVKQNAPDCDHLDVVLLHGLTERNLRASSGRFMVKTIQTIQSFRSMGAKFNHTGGGVKLLCMQACQRVYNIGIEVKQGRGRYRDTNFVTFAPRYQVDNRSRHTISISQKHFTKSSALHTLNTAPLQAMPRSQVAFDWPRIDLDQLMCVQAMEKDGRLTSWSGGFTIDKVSSFYANMRHANGTCLLLKAEVCLVGPTYLILFTDAEQLPPPYRIENFSEVSVVFHQDDVNDKRLEIVTQPQTSVNYSWDEPTLPPRISLSVHGGTGDTVVYPLDKLGDGREIHYKNSLYIAATATFTNSQIWGSSSSLSSDSVGSRNLVLDVKNNEVLFSRKQEGKRSQLWRRTNDGLLIHEDSTPPLNPHQLQSITGKEMVLDIKDTAPPGRPPLLMLRRIDRQRAATQSWYFDKYGYLVCGVANKCVQAIDISLLKDGGFVSLGVCDNTEPPQEHMQMSSQALQKGSGSLSVQVVMDGPTRCLRIVDSKDRKLVKKSVSLAEGDEKWEVYEQRSESVSSCKNESPPPVSSRLLSLTVKLTKGLGVSVVNHVPEELTYIALIGLSLDYSSHPELSKLTVNVAKLQIDNNLFGTQCPVTVFVTPVSRSDLRVSDSSALHINIQKIPNTKWNTEIFKHIVVTMKMMSIQLEERLLWKLLQFGGFQHEGTGREQTAYKEPTSASPDTKRYYFSRLRLDLSRIMLSVITSKLPPDLKAIKNALSVPLFQFENARVDLYPFERVDVFETLDFLKSDMLHYFTQEMKGQAASIFGSVDFLGNPLGLFNDVADGITGLIKDGNVSGLLKNVAHGTSNWAAKVTGAISDGVNTAGMDESHNEQRAHIKEKHSTTSGGQLVAGVKGFGFGLYGGLTSIFTQPYRGVRESGLEGFVKGVGKGAVGVITKPVAGVLDLVSGTAGAVSNKSSSHKQPKRVRPTRCCKGSGGLIPPYNQLQAEAQAFLYKLNSNKFTEFFLAEEKLRSGERGDSYRVLITSRQIYVLRPGRAESSNIVLKVTLHDLLRCGVVTRNKDGVDMYYLELVMMGPEPSQYRQPQFRCDKEQIARRVAQQIDYAKNMHEERRQTLICDKTFDESNQ